MLQRTKAFVTEWIQAGHEYWMCSSGSLEERLLEELQLYSMVQSSGVFTAYARTENLARSIKIGAGGIHEKRLMAHSQLSH